MVSIAEDFEELRKITPASIAMTVLIIASLFYMIRILI